MIKNGKSSYVIVHGKNCIPAEKTAAETLQNHLEKISGVKIPIVTDESSISEYEIIVGKTNREGKSYPVIEKDLGSDGVYIKSFGQTLVISGGQPRGTLYAVYTFLEEYLDCRWFTSELIIIPKKSTVEFPKDYEYIFVPPLEYRETDWISPHNITYSVANKLNGLSYRVLDENVGGGIGYAKRLCHTFTSIFVKPEEYYDEHPEYFALIDGKRIKENTQLCLTNPDVLQVVIDEVQAMLDEDPGIKLISLTQADNQNYCRCEKCEALNKREDSCTATNLAFVNAVARHFKDKYPNLKFDTFAYQHTRKPPKTLKPESNVVVRLCSIECCFAHPLCDESCSENAHFKSDIEQWSKIADKLYIWDYTTNYANYNAIFPNFKVLKPNMKFFVEHNAVGIYEEGNYEANVSNGEFAELRAYLLSKLLWNPDADTDKLTEEFCKAYYGEAAEYIMEYIKVCCLRAATNVSREAVTFGEKTHMRIYAGADEPCMDLTVGDVKYFDEIWEKAKSAKLTDEQLKNVKLSEISWRYWKKTNEVSEFTSYQSEEKQLAAAQKLYDDMKAAGITRIHECYWGVMTDTPDLMKKPFWWKVGK